MGHYDDAMGDTAAIGIFGCTERGEVLTPRAEVPDARVQAMGLDIASGQRHACATRPTAFIVGGPMTKGNLELATTVSSASPRLVLGGAHFLQVAAGADHNCALDDLGTVYCSGWQRSRSTRERRPLASQGANRGRSSRACRSDHDQVSPQLCADGEW